MPWTVSDVDRFKTGLSTEQKKQWVAIANGVLNDCLDSGKPESECAALAIRTANSQVRNNTEQQGGKETANLTSNPVGDIVIQPAGDNAATSMILCQTAQPAYVTRELTYEGKTHLVIPVVMMVEGVHNGSRGPVFHSAEELGKIVEAWNGIPVTIGHPVSPGGNFVSANDPGVLVDWSVGRVFHAYMDGDKLKAEVWLNKEKLETVSPKTLALVQAGEPVEVSVGVFSEDDESAGEWNGENYIAIARNHRPDHLALLPDEVGACSMSDGCGLRVNNDNMKGGKNDVNVNEELLKSLVTQGFSTMPTVHQQGMTDILNKLQRVLDTMDHPTASHYLEEAYSDHLIYNKRSNAGNELYKQTYKVKSDGTIELTGEPVKVVKKVEYIEIQPVQTNKTNVKVMCEPCKERVDELIAHEGTHFTEDDREWLEALTEDKLDKMIPKMIRTNKESVKPPTIDEAWDIIQKGAQPNDYMAHIPDEVKIQINTEIKTKEEHDALVQSILANSQNELTAEELGALSVNVLKKLVKPEGQATYVGQTGGAGQPAKAGVAPMPLPGVKLES